MQIRFRVTMQTGGYCRAVAVRTAAAVGVDGGLLRILARADVVHPAVKVRG